MYKSDGTTCSAQGLLKTPISLTTSASTSVEGSTLSRVGTPAALAAAIAVIVAAGGFNGNIERVLGLGRSVDAAVLLVCYGQRWHQASELLTEDEAADQIDEFISAGGNVTDLVVALYRALNESGVYGKVADEPRPTGRGRRKAAPAAH